MQNLAKPVRRILKKILGGISILFVCLVLMAGLAPGPAFALTCAPCGCISANHSATRGIVTAEHVATRAFVRTQFEIHREQFIVLYWFKEHVLAAMMMMTEQLVSMAMNQMFLIGGFLDAQMQLETQRLFQELAAQAHKDYRPSFGMCEIGTLSRSLSASQRRGEFNAFVLSQHMQDRQMRNYSTASSASDAMDIVHRWEQFRQTFCNPNGNDQWLGARTTNPICTGTTLTSTAQRDRDIDYGLTVDYPYTIDMDLTNNAVGGDEEAVFALASNLYGNDVFSFFPEAFFEAPDKHDEYMYIRSIVAKRSVAQNSFNAIVGMKSAGKPQTATDLQPYMGRVLEQLGIPDSGLDYVSIIGERPSYYAQMEFLTKKLYQRPVFYTNLYDTPANVERKKAALQALGLVQNMDLFKSKLRTEAALAVLTEVEIFKQQEQVQNRMNAVRGTGRE